MKSRFLCSIDYYACVSRRGLAAPLSYFHGTVAFLPHVLQMFRYRSSASQLFDQDANMTRLDLVTGHFDFIPDMYFPHGGTLFSQSRCLNVWQ